MQFDTLSKEARPVRLSEQTRAFAYESLYEFRYGLDTERCAGVEMDETKGFGAMPPLARYDAAVAKIAAEAPVRICAGEKISGAATLGGALKHCVPAYFRGEPVFPGVSHLTVDYKTVLSGGYEGLRARICAAEAACADRQKLPFYRSLKNAVDSFEAWHARYLAALAGRREYENNYRILSRVPKYGATCFYEAVQSIWFTFAFLRLCGNWPGIGRLDALLGGYLKRDLAEGRLTLAEAREILAHFFIKGCEWITGKSDGSGDAQHYQNIVLAGTDGRGRDVTNEVTYLVLDIVEELGIGDFPIAVRIGKNTEEKLLVRIAEVIRHGGGIVAVYNEDLILKSLAGYGYPAEEAAEFANDGCWEVQIPGKTQFTYIPVDALALLQKKTLNGYEGVSFDSFEALYAKFTADLNEKTEAIFSEVAGGFGQISEDPKQWRWKEVFPCTVISLFEEDCIGRGLSYLEGGAVYNVFSPHIGGVADAANSLLLQRVYGDSQEKLGGRRTSAPVCAAPYRLLRQRQRRGGRTGGANPGRFCRRLRENGRLLPGIVSAGGKHVRQADRLGGRTARFAARPLKGRGAGRELFPYARHRLPGRDGRHRLLLQGGSGKAGHGGGARSSPPSLRGERGRGNRRARRADAGIRRAGGIFSAGGRGGSRRFQTRTGTPGGVSRTLRAHFGLERPLRHARPGVAEYDHREGRGEMKAAVTEIQRFCTHDGPGIRTTVFFAGCPLSCKWCHNPEAKTAVRQIFYTPASCIGCGACLHTGCGAHAFSGEGHVFDRARCVGCGRCAMLCPTGALACTVRHLETKEILAEVLRDRAFYGSTGGLTLSGGEPLYQPESALDLLERAKTAGLHTAVETCGYCEEKVLAALAGRADLLLFDLKDTDGPRHLNNTGAPLFVILDRLRYADRAGLAIRLRCLILEGINADAAHIKRVKEIAAGLKHLEGIDLIPYHPMGSCKYARLGIAAAFDDKRYVPSPESLRRLKDYLKS